MTEEPEEPFAGAQPDGASAFTPIRGAGGRFAGAHPAESSTTVMRRWWRTPDYTATSTAKSDDFPAFSANG